MKFPVLVGFLFVFLSFGNSSTASFTSLNSSYVSREPRIINGTAIPITTAPYMVSIRMKNTDSILGFGAGVICGGAVISQRMIITAASCITNGINQEQELTSTGMLTVVMGSIYLDKTDNNTLEYNVQKTVAHPNFKADLPLYDIAAVFIDGYIPWNWTTVKALQLNSKETPVGTNCTVTGWKIQLITTDESTLVSVTDPIMNNTACSAYTGHNTIPQGMLCAGYSNFSGISSCAGDTGDPLVCNGLLTGIVPTQNCGEGNYAGYFVNVSDSFNWIIRTNASFNYSSYGASSRIYIYSSSMVFISMFVALILHY